MLHNYRGRLGVQFHIQIFCDPQTPKPHCDDILKQPWTCAQVWTLPKCSQVSMSAEVCRFNVLVYHIVHARTSRRIQLPSVQLYDLFHKIPLPLVLLRALLWVQSYFLESISNLTVFSIPTCIENTLGCHACSVRPSSGN